MGIKLFKPTSPGRRFGSSDDYSDITKSRPEKALTVSLKKTGGRNNQGKITVHHHGGGAKQRYRIVDFGAARIEQEAVVKAIEYDPNRSSRIALIQYADNQRSYIIAPKNMKVGDKIIASNKKQEINSGNRMPVQYIPAGIMVYNIELHPGKGGKVARSAGNGAIILSHENEFSQIKMPSGELRNISKDCLVTIGQVSNEDWRNVRLGKAGRMRHYGVKPTVRGKAKNPVDHPHGGGEGHNPIGMKYPKTASGKHAFGVKTRKTNRLSDRYIVRRRIK